MSRSTIRLVVDFDPGVEPIKGVVQQPPNGDPVRFVGWLQLTQTLEALRNSAPSDRQASTRAERGNPANPVR
jgi:hypothetical protein